jgi:hypothetical protein
VREVAETRVHRIGQAMSDQPRVTSSVANFSGRHKSNFLRLSEATVVKPRVRIHRGALRPGKPIFSISWRAGRHAPFSADDPDSCRPPGMPDEEAGSARAIRS